MDRETLGRLLTVTQLAAKFGVAPGVIRRASKAEGGIPGQMVALGKTGFDPEVLGDWTPPASSERAARVREDGRRVFEVLLTDEESAALIAEGYEVIDRRERAKARRAARKAAKAAAAEASGNDDDDDDDDEDVDEMFSEFDV